MRTLLLTAFFSISNLLFAASAQAAFKNITGRLYAGLVDANPAQLKAEMRAMNLTAIGDIRKIGGEFTYPVFSFLDTGFRIETVTASNSDAYSTTGTYKTTLNQTVGQLVARVPIVKSEYVRIDVFGAYGVATYDLDLQSSTQTASLKKASFSDGGDTTTTTFGGSIGIGWKGYQVYGEVGQVSGRASSLTRTGTLATNLQVIDLSGNYVAIGLMFDGSSLPSGSSSSKK